MFAQAAQLGISVSTFHHFTEMHLLKGPDEGHKDLVLLKVSKETKEEEKTAPIGIRTYVRTSTRRVLYVLL